jgi:hypothetical protein
MPERTAHRTADRPDPARVDESERPRPQWQGLFREPPWPPEDEVE